jgi:hypothetical protein
MASGGDYQKGKRYFKFRGWKQNFLAEFIYFP